MGIFDSIEMPCRTLSPAETAAAAEVHVRGSRAPAQRLLRLLHEVSVVFQPNIINLCEICDRNEVMQALLNIFP